MMVGMLVPILVVPILVPMLVPMLVAIVDGGGGTFAFTIVTPGAASRPSFLM